MKTRLLTKCMTLSSLASVLLLPGCCRPEPQAEETRFGIVVIFGKEGACKHLSGPAVIGAYRKDTIVWKIHNKCDTSTHTFALSDIRLAGQGYRGVSRATSREEADKARLERQKHEEVIPFDGSLSTDKDELRLKVKEDARPGHYTFVTLLDGKANEDDEADIWPPGR